MANSASDILNYNLGILVRIATLYQSYNHDKYVAHVDDLLNRSQFYYTQGLGSLANSVMKEITDGSIRGYYMAGNDTAMQNIEEQTMQKSLQLMQKYSPELLNHYNKSNAQPE